MANETNADVKVSRLVDFEDVKECVKIGIKHGWSLEEFLESMDLWDDFVELRRDGAEVAISESKYKVAERNLGPITPQTPTCNDNDLVSRSWLLAEYDKQHEGPPGGARKIIETAPPARSEQVAKLYELLDDVCKSVRSEHEDDSVCGLCQYDGAYMSDSGDWANECPGFDSADCFCMKNEIRRMCGVEEVPEP